MSVHISSLTTKGQTTVPEPIRTAMGLDVGKQLVWELTSDKDGKHRLTVLPSPSVEDLAGCLKSNIPFRGIRAEKDAARKARAGEIIRREKRTRIG